MRNWTVAAGLLEEGGRLLLVQNARRDGTVDWSTPGGVVDPGESTVEALTREVVEETGLTVTAWDGPVWEVFAEAPDMGWTLRVEVHRAVGFAGTLDIDDPDGIVVAARWLDPAACHVHLEDSWIPAREPMQAWLAEPWSEPRTFRYRVRGLSKADANVVRLG